MSRISGTELFILDNNKTQDMNDFKLNTILENMDAIPSNPMKASAKFNDKPSLTREEKKALMDKVGKYNTHASVFNGAEKIVELANEMTEIAKLAKTYAVNECDEWFQTETIKRDFNNMDKIVSEFTKVAKECYGSLQRARALFDDCGGVLDRYYEISDVNPTTELPSDQLPPEESPVEEIIPNESPEPMKLGSLGVNWNGA